MHSNKTAIVIGATGLVGSHLVQSLLDNPTYHEVRVFVRREMKMGHPKLKSFVVDFNSPISYEKDLKGDVLFSCMGTTLKIAGSKEAQYKVDYTFQFHVAECAKKNGVSQMILVSATGANSQSMFFYSRMKGELEDAIKRLKFDSTVYVRPSVLIGDRPENRTGEKISVPLINAVSKIFPSIKKYKGIKGEEVAQAMLQLSNSFRDRFICIELDELLPYSSLKK